MNKKPKQQSPNFGQNNQNIMNEESKLKAIINYLNDYFENRIIADLNILLEYDKKKEELSFTLPYILLVNAGIDFLGGLEMGFAKNNSKERSCNFLRTWMAQEYELYGFPSMDSFIYDFVRNGLVHQAIFKRDVESYKGFDYFDKHLFVRENTDGEKRIFIHTKHYVEDFLKANARFKKEFIQGNNIDILYSRLFIQKDMNNLSSSELIKKLEEEGFVFKEDPEPIPSPAPPEE